MLDIVKQKRENLKANINRFISNLLFRLKTDLQLCFDCCFSSISSLSPSFVYCFLIVMYSSLIGAYCFVFNSYSPTNTFPIFFWVSFTSFVRICILSPIVIGICICCRGCCLSLIASSFLISFSSNYVSFIIIIVYHYVVFFNYYSCYLSIFTPLIIYLLLSLCLVSSFLFINFITFYS